MYDYRFTDRMERIFELAVDVARGVIYPHHLLIGACQEGTGVCGELYLYMYQRIGPNFVEEILDKARADDDEYFYYNDQKFSRASITVLDRANELKNKYKQVFINEGHILQAVLEMDNYLLDEKIKEDIMSIACVARDLIVNLANVGDETEYINSIRRLTHEDLDALNQFIQNEFDERWLHNLDNLQNEFPIFIAEQDGEIIGFACHDTFEGKKGYFGPMGVAMNGRLSSVGKELLHRSLVDMAGKGYAYAILGGAGPIEFYEKNCGAKVIPKFL